MDTVNLPVALLAGMFTVASPCVLPLLPILLGSSAVRASRADRLRPLFVVSGFVLAFAGLGIALSLLSTSSEMAHTAVRTASVGLLALFGLMRIWPGPYDRLMAWVGGPLQRLATVGAGPAGGGGSAGGNACANARNRADGNGAGFLLGVSLGAVWTPCAGPVLASILVLAAQAQDPGRASLLLFSYALGAGVPMLAIAYGGRAVTQRAAVIARHAAALQRGFGVLLVATALAIHFQYDVLAYAWIAGLFH